MFNKTANRRRLGFEGLERRELLAGNVSAGLDVNGNLVLTGDFANNHVMVTKGFFAGTMLVQGGRSVASDPNSVTLVNGQTTSLTFSTTGGIVLNMGDGNDSVLVTNLGVTGNITGELGIGNDQIALESSSLGLLSFTLNNGATPTYGKVSVSGFVDLAGRGGADIMSLYDATISGNLTFTGGDGADNFASIGSTPNNNVVGGSVLLTPGNGNDSININRMAVGANFTVNDGSALTQTNVSLVSLRVNFDILMNLSIRTDIVTLLGEDTTANRFQARNVTINTGDGADNVRVDMGIMVNLSVSTGAGNERNTSFGVLLTNLTVNTQLFLDTGDGDDSAGLNLINTNVLRVFARTGNDIVVANRITAQNATFDTAEGNDFVGLHDASSYALLSVLLGDGDDTLQARALRVTSSATFNGGLGFNTYQDQGGNFYNSLTRINI